MSTHGRMLVTGGHGDDGHVHLYAWHDGHTNEALDMLLRLPFTVFAASKARARANDLEQTEITTGPWFYEIYVDREKQRHNYLDFNNLLSSFQAMIPLGTCAIGVANWIVWKGFNHWHVVPSLDWTSYPGDEPDITIEVDDGRLAGYNLIVGKGHDPDDFHKELEETVGELNKHIVHKEAKIIIHGKKSLTEDNTTWILPKVYVPFDYIVIDLLHQDIVKKYGKKKSVRNARSSLKG